MLLDEPTVGFYGTERAAAVDRDAIKAAIHLAGQRDAFILGEEVERFESLLASRIGAANVVATSCGTTALRLALQALGLERGDEVIVPAYGFHATASAVLHLGARPILVDVQPDTWGIDLDAFASALSTATVGVIPVHMFAAMVDMQRICSLASNADLWVLENSAVAIGSSKDDRNAGLWGDVGLYSLHPVKPLGGVSDAAVLVTRSDELAASLRMLRNHGQDGVRRFIHHAVGYNARMDGSAAAVLTHRLTTLDDALGRRAGHARRYTEGLTDLAPELGGPRAGWEDVRCWYAYVVRCGQRDALEAHLADSGVETKVYYPEPLHLQGAFAELGYRAGSFPQAELASRQTLALPLHPELRVAEIDHVIATIREFYGA